MQIIGAPRLCRLTAETFPNEHRPMLHSARAGLVLPRASITMHLRAFA